MVLASPVPMAGSEDINSNESKMVVPLTTWILISNFKLAYNLLRRPDGTFDRHLAEFLDRKVPPNSTPINGIISFDLLVSSLLLRIYLPSTTAAIPDLHRPLHPHPFPVILFFHGGSFAHSSSNSAIYDSLCRRFVRHSPSAVVISVNYRRSPEHRYPTAYDDGWTALQWAHNQPFLRCSPDSTPNLFLSGDSSGGNIAHHVALRAATTSQIRISGNILLNPMFGGQCRTPSELNLDGKFFVTLKDRDWYWKAFLPAGADRDHPACNPFGPNAVPLSGLPFPKSLVVVAGLDLTHDWQLGYVHGLRDAGHDVKLVFRATATIGFYLLPNNDHCHLVMDEITNFLSSNCH
ncbi:hypothetical protein J5N97_008975 [Dioscorea zingiberensis]|uniref:Alpha/beta hydrolase fold-3 domain-containing protein n=1 Tax=Dioscorea zingiberensis TaxID=325984 RepID=A0A9D5CVI2_9LILI|nr:hypothetical protein J5N97_008975 [Dioscorea zingiberensis]